MERCFRVMQGLRFAAEAEETLGEAKLPDLKAAFERAKTLSTSCAACGPNLLPLLAAMNSSAVLSTESGLPSGAAVQVALRRLRRGEKQCISTQQLRFCKAKISDKFRKGKQQGEPLEALVEKLVEEEQQLRIDAAAGLQTSPKIRDSLLLVAVKFHGSLFVVEGNRRLWAIREAEHRLGGATFEVNINVQDLYLGDVHGRTAIKGFWDKYSTKNEGKSVEVVHGLNEGAEDSHQDVSVSATSSQAPSSQSVPGGALGSEWQSLPAGVGSIKEWGTTLLTQSKHQGRTYQELAEIQPSFCMWVLKSINDKSSPVMQDFRNYLQASDFQTTSTRRNESSPAIPGTGQPRQFRR